MVQIIVRPPSIVDWYSPIPILGTSEKAAAPWDTLPPAWPDFAEQTLIASSGKYMPFRPYLYQRDLIKVIRRVKNVYVLKSRQVGASETIISYKLCQSIRKRAWTGVVFFENRRRRQRTCRSNQGPGQQPAGTLPQVRKGFNAEAGFQRLRQPAFSAAHRTGCPGHSLGVDVAVR